jgi:hypothetical protein
MRPITLEIELVPDPGGRAFYRVLEDGQPVPTDDDLFSWRTTAATLWEAWWKARSRAFDRQHSRGTGREKEKWEALQTFRERLILPRGAQWKLTRALRVREEARRANERAAHATRAAVVSLRSLGMVQGDIGELLGLTKMRVSQILKEADSQDE